MIYIPKGGMCANCKNFMKDCSKLEFSTMPVIAKDKEVIVVKCSEYVKK